MRLTVTSLRKSSISGHVSSCSRVLSLRSQGTGRFWNLHKEFHFLCLKNRHRQDINLEEMQHNRGSHSKAAMRSDASVSRGTSDLKPKKWAPWTEALRKIAVRPEDHGDIVLEVTQEAVVLLDQFPKGRKHLLVLSRQEGLDSLEQLNSSHIQLLKQLQALGEAWVQNILKEDQSLVFRLGYHSVPSMRQLHMHVISQDFDSPSLKNKKHWNSFTTSFFRDSKLVIEELESVGRATQFGDEKYLMVSELRCHRCQTLQPNIQVLKKHIQVCKAPFPQDLVEKGYLIMKKI